MQQLYPLFLLLLSASLSAQCPELVWSDEFDGKTLNLDNWRYELGDGCDRGLCGWGNNELQTYREENTTVSDGTLKITARREEVDGRSYTSSRLISRGKQDFTYGRMEARIKVPGGQGTWPAFWMLSTDEVYGSWPQSGEIDIMEYVGRAPNEVLGTIHYGQPWPNNSYNSNRIETEEPVADDFHEFAVEWEEDEIRWFFDGILYATETPADLNGQRWPFDQDFFFILNVAIGGNLGGAVDDSIFPATMEVDYVRVYGGNRPYISGERSVENAANGVEYTVGNLAEDTPITWTVPTGAAIVSGQGTPTLTVDWAGSTGGAISAVTTLDCGTDTLSLDVSVAAPYTFQRSLENFDDAAELTFNFATGILTEQANPAPDSLVGATQVGEYVRAAGSQYDVLIYDVSSITDAGLFVTGEQRFYIDLYTTAPVGTEILLQLETGSASGENYPTGRHSRYQATTAVQNGWQRLYLPLLDRPDPNANDAGVTRLILLFAPNSNTGDTYRFDNLDVYAEGSTGIFTPRTADFGLTASPNPATDQLQLRAALDYTGPLSISLFTAEGRLLRTASFTGRSGSTQTLRLPVADLAPGVYLARVQAGSKSATVRFLR
ncbi:family 16 glycosylhydrolase [Neolewinella sp.]|uniref:family 16 glycosylhydrolase n=1 Tax=Neolewinella sp. TaxID=2993543 RepID=UPI003B520CF0